MKRKKFSTARIRLVGLDVPAAAVTVAAGLLTGAAATAAPGDIDPSFGQTGRVSDVRIPNVDNLNAIAVRDDDAVFFAGGGEFPGYYDFIDDFIDGLSPDGTPNPAFFAAALNLTLINDTALQPDGRLVGVGMAQQPDGRNKLVVVRLLATGGLDATFGLNGVALISDGTASRELATSVTLEADGSIVVAGARSGNLLVARLLENGTLDGSFGNGGVYVGPAIVGEFARIARATTGGYRVVFNTSGGGAGSNGACRVAGLTPSGALSGSFGNGGLATAPSAGTGFCRALTVQADGRTIVAGRLNAGPAFLARLQANGSTDGSFDASTVLTKVGAVTALGVGANGRIYAAGSGPAGINAPVVARALGNGALDTAWGRAGATIVVPESRNAYASIADLEVSVDDKVVVGGTVYMPWADRRAFVARLLGSSGGASPGVFSVTSQQILVTEQGANAVVTVRRDGGGAGAVAVSYATQTLPRIESNGTTYTPGEPATSGVDFATIAGRLTWADGDISDRQIVVPISTDTEAERPEWFEVLLGSPEGGAGLGLHGTEVEIAGASYPFGEFTISGGATFVPEGSTVQIRVDRNYYAQGAASVTLRAAAGGTASPGTDFRLQGSTDGKDVVLTWGDGEKGAKTVSVTMVNDNDTTEVTETFTLELVGPTGGALLGSATQAAFSITSPTTPPPPDSGPPSSNGGGGSFGGAAAWLLVFAGAVRRWVARRQHGSVANA